MKKNIFKYLLLAVVLLSLLIIVGCPNDNPTNPPENLDYDEVDVTLIGNWDLWEYQEATAGSKEPSKAMSNNSLFRNDYGIPALVEELYADIQQHIINIDGFNIDSSTEEIESVHLMDNQIWTEDVDENATFYYDYFYNDDTGALWLCTDTTLETDWAIDPTLVDTIYVGPDSTAFPVDINNYTLLFRFNSGPMPILTEPENDLIISETLTPTFLWVPYDNAVEYTIQVRADTMFSQEDEFIINETLGNTNFTPQDELSNFEDYYWRVKADNSGWSSIWNFATHQVVELVSPMNRNHEGLKPDFTWETLQGALDYTLLVSDDVDFLNPEIEVTITETNYFPLTYLQPETKYYWKVTGDNSEGNWSETRYIITDKRLSLNSNATPADDATEVLLPVEFEWSELSNASNYTIEVSLDSLFSNHVFEADTATNGYVESGVLETNNIYFWRVMSDVAIDWSDTLSFGTNDIVQLNSPENDLADIGVITEFKWERFNDDETVYVIQVAADEIFGSPIVDSYIYYDGSDITCETASRIQENEDDDLIEFIPLLVEDFDPMTTYYWRVQRDSLEWSNTWNFTTLDFSGETELTEPTDGFGNVEPFAEFKWESIFGAEFYRLQVSDNPNLGDPLFVNKVVTDRTYTLSDDDDEMLIVGETYYWRVSSDRTSWSPTWWFTVRTGIPYDLEVIGEDGYNDPETPNKVDLSWDCLGGEYTDFWIERSDDGGTTWIELGSVDFDARDYVDFDLAESSNYYYRIRSEYPLGFSGYSEPVTVETRSFIFDNEPVMATVESGTFNMGSISGDEDETPVREITLTHDFQIGILEITNLEYCEVLNWALGKGKVSGAYNDLSYVYADDAFALSSILEEEDGIISFSNTSRIFKVELGMENLPITGVTWFGAIAYTNWLSMINNYTTLYTGTTSVSSDVYGNEGYRLPTEAEWEYAAIEADPTVTYLYSGSDIIDDVAWHFGNSNEELHNVGLKDDNSLGIFDMSGNAWEWCNDKKDDYDPGELTDPVGPTGNIGTSTLVSVRGGSWEFEAYNLRNTNRSSSKANLSYKVNTSIGFRIVKINP